MKISVVGLGSVGTAAYNVLQENHDVNGFDIDGRGDWKDVLDSELSIICVSTNAGSDGRLDMSNINSVIERLMLDDYDGVIVVKSTLQPNTVDRIISKYPRIKISYVPEFLREKDALEWFKNPDRIVFSSTDNCVDAVLECFIWVPESVPRIRMTHLEAEFGKLAHNAYIATKVTFTCEIERIAKAHQIDPLAVMKVVWTDRRVNCSDHLTPGLGGFGGKCVPKDTAALAFEDEDYESLFHILDSRGSSKAVSERGG